MQDKGYTVVSNTREKPSDSPDKFIRLSPDLLDELAVAQVAKEIADALGVRTRTVFAGQGGSDRYSSKLGVEAGTLHICL